MSEGKALWTDLLQKVAARAREAQEIADRTHAPHDKAMAALRIRNEALDDLDRAISGPNALRLVKEHAEMAERLSARARLMGLAWIKLAPADDAMAAALREAATDDLALLSRLEEGQ
jgi:hypothetical protein